MDQRLADSARFVLLYCGGRALNVSVPNDALTRIPLDDRFLAKSKSSNLRLIEIRSDPQFTQVSHLQQQFALLHKFSRLRIDRVNGTRLGRSNRGLCEHLLRRRAVRLGILQRSLRSCEF